MQAHSPTELQTAKQAIFRTGIPMREYLDRMSDIEARAEAEIMAYVKVMRATPAIALLRIAAKMSSGVDEELIDAMLAHPILINRPIVVTPLGVKLCRPSEAVLDILPNPDIGPFTKDDGDVVIDTTGRRVR